MSFDNRTYQEAIWDKSGPLASAFRRNHNHVILGSPCGSGKTTIMAGLAQRMQAKGLRVGVVAHRRRLIEQISERFGQFSIDYGVTMADLPEDGWAVYKPEATVQVCSRDTLESRKEKHGLPECDVLFVDECHISQKTYEELSKELKAKYVIGLTATPCNPDGSGMSRKFWDELIPVTTIEHLIANRWLAPLEVFAPAGIAARRRRGLDVKVTGDPLEHWLEHANGLPTVVFTNSVAEALEIERLYQKNGVESRTLHAKTPHEEREEVLKAFRDGIVKVLTNVDILGPGVDIPEIECVQLLTKCSSPSRMWQLMGRAARTCFRTGKEHGVVLDHAAAYAQHGHPNISPIWSLDENDSVQNRVQQKMEDNPQEFEPIQCGKCGMVSVGISRCPKCSEPLYRRRGKKTETDREQLQRVDESGESPVDPRQKSWHQFLWMAAKKGQTVKVACAMFKGKHGLYPSQCGVLPSPKMDRLNDLVTELFPSFEGRKRA
jgi:DNA repair protein RadD